MNDLRHVKCLMDIQNQINDLFDSYKWSKKMPLPKTQLAPERMLQIMMNNYWSTGKINEGVKDIIEGKKAEDVKWVMIRRELRDFIKRINKINKIKLSEKDISDIVETLLKEYSVEICEI